MAVIIKKIWLSCQAAVWFLLNKDQNMPEKHWFNNILTLSGSNDDKRDI